MIPVKTILFMLILLPFGVIYLALLVKLAMRVLRPKA